MRNFILRNKQIFITGLIIGGVFLLIIFSSSTRKVKGPILAPSETSNTQTEDTRETGGDYRPRGLWNVPSPSDEPVNENAAQDTPPEEEPLVKPTEILDITFNDKGFSPPAANGFKYQTVRWKNETDNTIYLQQMKDFFEEFKEPVEVAPEAVLEFELTKAGMWGYRETESGEMGSIFIVVQRTTN
ncbi:hypothetical protein A2380_04080 [candidate division WWE3 bacterium RIFOXYB1_FULL_43_24]|uniref:Uncharacterized protein n=2 Tax=Katanobacteria TaxID=422282 RepID=A0A0G1AS72_UNCKA|nr:MAG: hypothetical protein UU92_C0019G0009 [candidate division WWE3 bacterium GW2011_GWA1_42_12]KKS36941.1 MAG: hypothetical protein UV00_C0019G0042 [candidate division WWE3 bacterium GW2011_GWF1_42_14]KKS39898.1 MAG: hypothetical protein UV03_C0017G0006 [candidate division WWE3 bacterium GW2011_GWE1_42_16]KKS65957.1 MAG: hypothetical protein UV35_C0028G0006 [candidate division WWE3 bacterium GW2011_GWB1_42_6]OGC59419.1 MAG: hypothetical protein A2212_00760 [candidate division WWE3 bacterium 